MNNASPLTPSGAAGLIALVCGVLLIIGSSPGSPPSSCPGRADKLLHRKAG